MNLEINSNSCRLCLENVGIIPLFQDHGGEMFAEMISSLFNIDVIYDENLPTTGCTNCLENVKFSIITKNVILNSESMLSIYLNSNNTIGKSAENLNQIKVEDKDPVEAQVLIGIKAEEINIERFDDSLREFEDEENGGHVVNVQTLPSINPQTELTASFKYDCEICGFQADTYKRLMSHDKIHSGTFIGPARSKPKQVPCIICGKKIVSSSMKRHIRAIHLGEKPFSCSYCDKTFSTTEGLNSHMQTHLNSNDNLVDPETKELYLKYKCDECDKAFVNSTFLKSHKVIHSGEKQQVCPHCGKQFALKKYLKRHIQLVHNTDNPRNFKSTFHRQRSTPKKVPCKFCGKMILRSSLSRHMRSIHLGEKPFSCSYCDKAFSRTTSLNTHMQIHLNSMDPETKELYLKYKCGECDKAFVNSALLKLHKVIHSGENPRNYKCNICGRVSVDLNRAKSHLLTHNVVNPRSYSLRSRISIKNEPQDDKEEV